MPVAKLGQIASNQINDIAQKHFDIDMRIRDTLTTATLNAKQVLASRLPSILEQIESELVANQPPL